MTKREALRQAIQDYVAEVRDQPMSQGLVEQLQALDQEVAAKPDPVSQGAGSWPAQQAGGSGERERPAWPDKGAMTSALRGEA